MNDAIDRAAQTVGMKVTAFVEASDRLVNLLSTEPQGSEQSKEVHAASVRLAYDGYDAARAALLGIGDVSDA